MVRKMMIYSEKLRNFQNWKTFIGQLMMLKIACLMKQWKLILTKI